MRKVVLFVVSMCCMVSAFAQQTRDGQELLKQMQSKIKQVERWNRYTNTFSETLDSIYEDFQKHQFEYDNRLNCVKIDYYWWDDEWFLNYTEELAYDEQDRVVMWMESDGDSGMKSEFTYDENGWLSEENELELMEGVWELVGRYTYEYDAEGNMVLSEGYEYEEEWLPTARMTWEYENGKLINDIYYYHGETDWMPLTRNDYNYNDDGLCQQQLQSQWEGAWTESYKVEYEYDEAGNRVLQTSATHYDLDDWMYTYKVQYNHDANGNIIASADYYYNETDWELESTMTYNYDLTVPVEATAGIMMVWDDELPIHNKLLDWELRANDDAYTTTFYYSNCVGLTEKPENLLTVYPNPAWEKVTIDGSEVTEVQVYNALGQKVKTVRNTNEIPVSDLPQGVYLLRITNAMGVSQTERITVIR